ncbi:MAG: hypothetical protein WC554_04290 [Clostridia bacterium]
MSVDLSYPYYISTNTAELDARDEEIRSMSDEEWKEYSDRVEILYAGILAGSFDSEGVLRGSYALNAAWFQVEVKDILKRLRITGGRPS